MTKEDKAEMLRIVSSCAWPMVSDHPFATFADRLADEAARLSAPDEGHHRQCRSCFGSGFVVGTGQNFDCGACQGTGIEEISQSPPPVGESGAA